MVGQWWEDTKYTNALTKLRDPVWFFEHMLVLRYIKGKPQFFKVTDMQREILTHVYETLEKGEPIKVILLKGRRIGYSTLMAGLLLWNTLIKMIEDSADKEWDIISASYLQATMLFDTTKRMITFNPLLLSAVMENKGGKRLYSDSVYFQSPDKTLRSTVSALASGGATKRGRSPDGIVWDEAAQVKDEDYHDLSISSLSGDNHEFIGSTPFDDSGWFYDKATNAEKQGYTIFHYPMAEVTDEGMEMVNDGEHRDLTVEHIIKVHGCKKSGGHMSPQEVVEYLQTVDSLTARREVFGQFVGGDELYYESAMVKDVMYDMLPVDIWNLKDHELDEALTPYSQFRMGIDWAGGGAHKTCISLLALHTETGIWHEIFWDSWIRTKYTDQWQRVKLLYNRLMSRDRDVKINCDATGTQDTNVDALRGMGVPAAGITFSFPEKLAMARSLWELMHRHQVRLGMNWDKLNELCAVDAKLKGDAGHLGDWVAAIWCACREIKVYQRGNSQMFYSGDRVNPALAQRTFQVERGQINNL